MADSDYKLLRFAGIKRKSKMGNYHVFYIECLFIGPDKRKFYTMQEINPDLFFDKEFPLVDWMTCGAEDAHAVLIQEEEDIAQEAWA